MVETVANHHTLSSGCSDLDRPVNLTACPALPSLRSVATDSCPLPAHTRP